MIRATPILMFLVLLACAGTSSGAPLRNPDGSPNGNPHDLSSDNTANPVRALTETQVCVFCHTPHGASASTPLWNRFDPAAASSYVLYGNGASGNLAIIDDATAANASQYGQGIYPNGASRLCLSCHDGASAVGFVLNAPGGTGSIEMTYETLGDAASFLNNPDAIIDLATSHPISFVYDSNSIVAINAWSQQTDTYKTPNANAPLDNYYRMQCTTCHDPHETAGGTLPPFWRAASYNDVCNACHTNNMSGFAPHLM